MLDLRAERLLQLWRIDCLEADFVLHVRSIKYGAHISVADPDDLYGLDRRCLVTYVLANGVSPYR